MAKPDDDTTASMQAFGTHAAPDARGGTRAGLVRLHASEESGVAPVHLFERLETVVGRDPSCELVVAESATSRRHARFAFVDGRWVVEDLGSRNGTLVDGAFVGPGPLDLEDGHEIRVGDAVFKFVAAGAERYARHSASESTKSLVGMVGGLLLHDQLRALHRVATAEIAVIVLGESGTGKELVARELHAASGRRGSFQAVNCAAIPATLLESELFGYKRGAFSGAERDKPGIFRAADGGTLFLDEIGDMPLDAQAKLLRVLQSREIIPVGATAPERVDVRIVSATHQNLAELQRASKFRGDLYARLNEYSVTLPPLRERKEDITPLVASFLARHPHRALKATAPFMVGLLHYDWPFNVRELEGAIKRAVALAECDTLGEHELPDAVREAMRSYGTPPRRSANAPGASQRHTTPSLNAVVPPTSDAAQREPHRPFTPTESDLREALSRHRGNVAAVGRVWGKERMQVHRWLKRYGIDLAPYRDDAGHQDREGP